MLYFVVHVDSRKFDPFAPVWLFLVGYIQVYIIQAISAITIGPSRARGKDLVTAANFRASGRWSGSWRSTTWASAAGWLRYFLGLRAGWSPTLVAVLSPPLILWGLFCAGMLIRPRRTAETMSAEESLFRSFPFVMMVAAILLVVHRTVDRPRPPRSSWRPACLSRPRTC